MAREGSRGGAGRLVALAGLSLLAGCGAKTGLLLPDAEIEPDAAADAGPDALPDADRPEDGCTPSSVAVELRRAQVVFVVDRSESMRWALDGEYPEPGEETRWDLLGDALDRALAPVERLLAVGAKFYPVEDAWVSPEASCEVSPGIELEPASGNRSALAGFFASTAPNAGGTPTAPGLAEARDWLVARGDPSVARFVVLATDGGPNCRERAPVPFEDCICTGPPVYCPDPSAFNNCLDDERTLEVVESTFLGQGIPVFVIGIDDPGRPDLADFLDEMAVAGGRPRPLPAERRFYSVRREGELDDALELITSAMARCVFVTAPSMASEPDFEIQVDGEPVRRDPGRLDGWDWTAPEAGELTLFGTACERASRVDARVGGLIACP